MEKYILINKPISWTSFDVVAYIRNRLRAADPEKKKIKVGHAGTLDPFATGLLIVDVGREATRNIDGFKALPKTYVATIHLGAVSDTLDSDGAIKESDLSGKTRPDFSQIEKTLQSFLGPQKQTPPMYSAKKIGGKRLYTLARQGIEVKREPVDIEIYDLKLVEYSWPLLKIEVKCSAGTYIRTVADDLGQKLEVGAYCEELARTRIGDYRVEDAIPPQDFKP